MLFMSVAVMMETVKGLKKFGEKGTGGASGITITHNADVELAPSHADAGHGIVVGVLIADFFHHLCNRHRYVSEKGVRQSIKSW